LLSSVIFGCLPLFKKGKVLGKQIVLPHKHLLLPKAIWGKLKISYRSSLNLSVVAHGQTGFSGLLYEQIRELPLFCCLFLPTPVL